MEKVLVLLLVTLFFSACESTNLLNGEKKYIINTDCGRVEITSGWKQSVGVKIRVKPLDGELVINADSTILEHPMQGTIIDTRVYHNNKRANGLLLLKKKDVLLYRIHIFLPIDYDQHYFTEYNKTYIIPNAFILCNGKPVITDTIKVRTLWMDR